MCYVIVIGIDWPPDFELLFSSVVALYETNSCKINIIRVDMIYENRMLQAVSLWVAFALAPVSTFAGVRVAVSDVFASSVVKAVTTSEFCPKIGRAHV